MSLKNFHLFFISVSTVVTAGFGLWCFLTEKGASQAGAGIMGAMSCVAAVGLLVYLVTIPRKLRDSRTK